jgi:hypothetical protein
MPSPAIRQAARTGRPCGNAPALLPAPARPTLHAVRCPAATPARSSGFTAADMLESPREPGRQQSERPSAYRILSCRLPGRDTDDDDRAAGPDLPVAARVPLNGAKRSRSRPRYFRDALRSGSAARPRRCSKPECAGHAQRTLELFFQFPIGRGPLSLAWAERPVDAGDPLGWAATEAGV